MFGQQYEGTNNKWQNNPQGDSYRDSISESSASVYSKGSMIIMRQGSKSDSKNDS